MLHDLVIRHVAEYLNGGNATLINLQRLNNRFFQLRDIFIGQICLNHDQSTYAFNERPYGWNKVYQLISDAQYLTNPINYDDLASIHTLHLFLHPIEDVAPLRNVHTLRFDVCMNLKNLESLVTVKNLTFYSCYGLKVPEILHKKVPKLKVEFCFQPTRLPDAFREVLGFT